jgi:hypothetical protein
MKYNKMTDREIKIMIANVEQNPVNIKYALQKTAKELNRNFGSLNSFYYRYIKKKTDLIITTGSKKGFSNNVKNQLVCKKTGTLTPELEPLHVVIKGMYELSKKERTFIVNFFSRIDKLVK